MCLCKHTGCIYRNMHTMLACLQHPCKGEGVSVGGGGGACPPLAGGGGKLEGLRAAMSTQQGCVRMCVCVARGGGKCIFDVRGSHKISLSSLSASPCQQSYVCSSLTLLTRFGVHACCCCLCVALQLEGVVQDFQCCLLLCSPVLPVRLRSSSCRISPGG